jgi:hypothetical protein
MSVSAITPDDARGSLECVQNDDPPCYTLAEVMEMSDPDLILIKGSL